MRKIVGIGETVMDIIFRNDIPTAAIPGGSTFNAMISLAFLDKDNYVDEDFVVQFRWGEIRRMDGTGRWGYHQPWIYFRDIEIITQINMKKVVLFFIMTLLTLTGCAGKKAVEPASNYPQDVITAKDGTEITLTFYAHASIAVEALGHQIYFDPVGENIDWSQEPKADLVLITHDHYDHYDAAVTEALNGTGEFLKMKPGETAEPFDGIKVEAVPAYNITEGHLNFHPQERGDAGYILTIGGTRIYVAGDTEDNDDVLALKDIDVAFLPVNQPYTMTVDQCVRVVEAIRPAVFYPYHFGGTDESTDIDALVEAVKDITDIRVRPLE